jgi:hypothetical protein
VCLREPTPEVYAEVEARIAATAAKWSELLERTRAEVKRRGE